MKFVFSSALVMTMACGASFAQSFSDNFSRTTLPPWIAQSGTWTVSGGVCSMGPAAAGAGYAQTYITNVWTNISAQARVRFTVGGYGGGLGARVNTSTGARYSAWIYPENSPGGSSVLKLIKFQNWSTFGYNGNSFVPVQQVSLASVGTNWHTLRMEIQTNLITVFLDGNALISTNDIESQPHAAGGVSLEMWTDATPYVMDADDVAVSTPTSTPIAYNDSYSATLGRTLTVAAPGVLANDGGGVGPLRALLVSSVAHGTLSLSTNGGFTYNATSGYTGPDSFSYRASDGVTNSPAATVSVTVNPNGAPVAGADSFSGVVNMPMVISAPGVLVNDSDPDGDSLTASLVSNATNGTVTLNANGSLTYTPNANFVGGDRFTYRANDGLANSSTATALLSVGTVGTLFLENFVRTTEPGPISPWINYQGSWTVSGGEMRAGTNTGPSYGIAYITNAWSNYVLEGRLRFQAGAFGGGISGRLNPATGARYAAWVYPESSAGGSNVLKLIKFQSWTSFGYNGVPGAVMQQANLAAVGTNFNRVKLAFRNNQIGVYWNGSLVMSATDAEASPPTEGAVALDWWTDSVGTRLVYDDIATSPIVTDDSYALNMESTLSVGVPGVMVNDTGVSSTNLSASVVNTTTNGTLSLNTNGSFSYTPVSNYFGADSFTYQVSDSQGVLGTGFVALTINKVNRRPVLQNQPNVTLVELTSLTVTNAATDPDLPPDNLTYSLISPPAGAAINAEGVITWTPSEAQGPSTNTIRTRVIDDGVPPLSTTNTFTVVVSELNLPPSLPVQNDVTIPEQTTLLVTNTAIDADLPANPFAYTLLTAPTGAAISPLGIISWPTTDADGGTTNLFVVSVNDNGVPPYSATNSFTVIVTDFNSAPVLPAQVNRTNPPLVALVITNTASDVDLPADALAYALAGPATAAISPQGIITWTPAETDYGTTNLFQTIVTDNGQPPLSTTNSFAVVVNSDPVLVLESATLALEQCTPANNRIDPGESVMVQFSLKNVGFGNTTNLVVSLLETNGVTRPGPSVNLGILVANGASVTQAFAFAATGYCGGTVLANLMFQDGSRDLGRAVATFSMGSPGIVLTQNFDSVTVPALPSGWASSGSGSLSAWVTQNTVRDTLPNAAFTTNVSAVGESLLLSPEFVVPGGPVQVSFRHSYVMEAAAPASGPAYDGGVLEVKLGTGAFNDIIAAGGSFVQGGYTRTISSSYGNSLSNRPAWSGNSGGFTNVVVSLPTSAAGQVAQLRWRCATDNGGTSGSGWRVDTIAVSGAVCCENTPPALAAIGEQTVQELTQLVITNTASDSSTPSIGLTYLLAEAPAGAIIDSTGIITWTPTEAQGPTTNVFTTIVTDSAAPPASATNTFLVVVTEVNSAPTLPAQTSHSVQELATLTVTNAAADADVPANILTYTLVNPPSGAQIDPNGIITWTPNGSQGGTTNLIETIVTDDGVPALSATNSFLVVVGNLNTAPVLLEQPDQTVVEMAALVVTNTALDDGAAEGLIYTLVNPPAGAAISASGIITWTPSEAQGPGTNLIQTVVTDSGVPPLSATNAFLVVISETNSAPVLPVQTNQAAVFAVTLSVTNTASDSDLPVNVLAYALASAPAGAAIDTNGVITWTPAIGQVKTTNVFETIVTDNGTPPLSATNSFSVVVPDISTLPSLPAQADRAVDELTLVTITNTATHPREVSYLLVTAPAGMQINANGVITWSPTEDEGPTTNLVQTAAIDPLNTALASTNSFTLIVAEVNIAPALPVQTDHNASVGVALSVTNTATDADLPANTLAYSLLNPPAGATINASGIIAWSPTAAQANTTNLVETVVTDNGVPPLSRTNTFLVMVAALPSTEPPVFKSITVADGSAVLTWTSVNNRNYRLEYKDGLEAASWTPVIPDIPSAGLTTKATNSISGVPMRFYRVSLVP